MLVIRKFADFIYLFFIIVHLTVKQIQKLTDSYFMLQYVFLLEYFFTPDRDFESIYWKLFDQNCLVLSKLFYSIILWFTCVF